MRANIFFLLAVLVFLNILLVGCNNTKNNTIESVRLTNVVIEPKEITRGETSRLWVDVKNDVNDIVTIRIDAESEDLNIVRVGSPIIRKLKPNETLGNKYIELTAGECPVSRCEVSITVRLLAWTEDNRAFEDSTVRHLNVIKK